jgi:hypothetical protein
MDSVPSAWLWDGDAEVVLDPIPLRHYQISNTKLSTADIAALRQAKESKSALQAEHVPTVVDSGHSHFSQLLLLSASESAYGDADFKNDIDETLKSGDYSIGTQKLVMDLLALTGTPL